MNLATTLAAQNALVAWPTSSLSPSELFSVADDFVVEALSLPADTELTKLDYNLIDATSTRADPNLQLLLFSGVGAKHAAGQLDSDSLERTTRPATRLVIWPTRCSRVFS